MTIQLSSEDMFEPRTFIANKLVKKYLTIRSRGRMDYESIAHEAVGQMDYSNL